MLKQKLRKRRLNVIIKRDYAVKVTRVSVGSQKLVYIILADKPLKYLKRWSKVAYIGTTQKGITRIARSVAVRADQVLSLHGVREFVVRVLTCPPRKNVKTWEKLERALLILFRDKYGALPRCNKQGKNMKIRNEFDYFKKKHLEKILNMFEY